MRISYTSIYKPILFLLFLLSNVVSFAQNGRIAGQVRDANGQPLQGASVQLQGGRGGTTTDADGNYSIAAGAGRQTLVISFVGFATQRVEVNVSEGTVTQNITLGNAGDLSTITVVGSRNASRTRVETPVPVDVIPISQVINDIGQVDLNQIINFIAPSFQSARQTIADGTDHVDPGQLRGLGTDQVLVLINGKRRHQSALVNVNGTVNRGQVGTDMSAIPATAIDRIEILRDGAAAQYGSDAIAGVINIVLKKRTGLLESNLSVGMHRTEYEKNYGFNNFYKINGDTKVKARDGETIQASLGYGFDIGKGYLSLNGEYIHRDPTIRSGTVYGRLFGLVNGQNRDDSIMNARGIDRNTFDMAIGQSKMSSGTLFYNFGYPLGKNDNKELYMFGGYGKKGGTSAGFYRYPNPEAGLTSITTGARNYAANVLAIYPNGFLPQINSEIMDFSTAIGMRTKFSNWNFDISNTYGVNRFDFNVDQSINYTQFAQAGNRQTSFDAGGLKYWQNTINADLSKKYDFLAGLNVATGAEFRVDAFSIRSGEEASYKNYDVASGAGAGAQVFPGFVNTIGKEKTRNAIAAYVDLEQDFTENFLVTGALRYERYSDFGSTLNYKLATRYKFSEAFNLRASLSTGFRAPSMQQKFYEKTNTLFQSINGALVPVESGTFTNDSKAAQILGIPELKEETSRNYSAGFTARPFRGLELTLDAYQINIDDRIILTNNFTGGNNTQLQEQLRNAGASTANFFANAIDTRSRGLEAVTSYTRSFGKHAIRTTLAATFIDNSVRKDDAGKPIINASPVLVNSGQLGNYFNREDQSRIEVANPINKLSLMFNYRFSKFGAMLRIVRFGHVEYFDPSINPNNPGAFPINIFTGQRETLDQYFSPKTVTDLSLSYQITSFLGLTIGANNLFDVYQDRHTHSNNMSFGRFVYSRRVQQMGFAGAYYFARLRLALPTNK